MKKIAIIIALLAGVSFSYAQVTGDIDPTGGPSDVQCISLASTNLRLGARDASTNNEVSLLQDFLNPHYLSSEPTGYFGKGTFAAVKQFQSDNGFSPTGYVGTLTKAKIKSISCGTTVDVPPLTPVSPTYPPIVPKPKCPLGTTLAGDICIESINPSCTKDAKICSDGSIVGRTGPHCDFTCPTAGKATTTPVTKPTYPTCAKDAKICSDGSVVGRTGSSCEFVCPGDTLKTGSAEIIGNQTTYAPGQTINFYVRTKDSHGNSAGPEKGFNVQYYMDSANQGGNAVYNPSKQIWSATLTAPSDTTKNYRVVAQFYCSNPSLGCESTSVASGNMGGQIEKSFTFSIAVSCTMDAKVCADGTVVGRTGPGCEFVCTNTPISETPSASLNGVPRLALEYDSIGKESSLIGRSEVEVVAGNYDLYIFSTSLRMLDQGGNSVYTNSNTNAMTLISGSAVQVPYYNDYYYRLPAGKKAVFSIVTKWLPREMFSGAYTANLKQLEAFKDSSFQQYSPVAVLYNTSNQITIAGELSPYITKVDVTPSDKGTQIIIKASRLEQSNTVTIGNITKTLTSNIGLGGIMDSISANPSDFGITTPGTYVVQVTTSKGASNKVYFQYNGGTATGPTTYTVTKPTLSLVYDAVGGESALKASFVLQVKAGSEQVTIARTSVGKIVAASLKYANGQVYSLMGQEPIQISDGYNNYETFPIGPGKTATLYISQTWNPKLLLSASYTASLRLYDPMMWGNEFLPANETNAVTVVGEQMPYISTSYADSDNILHITGQRFDLPGNQFTVDGVAHVGGEKGDATTASFSVANLALGGHFVQIINAQKGNSNNGYFTITALTPKPTVTAYANPISVKSSTETSLLSWSATNATGCVVDGESEVISGRRTVYAGNHAVSCSGPGGTASQGVTVSIDFPPANPSIISFTASPQTVKSGDVSTLTWQTSNASTCMLDSLPVSLSGSKSVYAGSHRLYCVNASGGKAAQDLLVQMYAVELSSPILVVPDAINFTGLVRGSNDERVSMLKAILNRIPSSVSAGCANLNMANTLFGPTTEECVRAFQGMNNLDQTGIIGEATNRALNLMITR